MVQRTWAAKSWPLAMRESPRVVMERVCRSESGRGFARIIARCGRQSPHLGVVVEWCNYGMVQWYRGAVVQCSGA